MFYKSWLADPRMQRTFWGCSSNQLCSWWTQLHPSSDDTFEALFAQALNETDNVEARLKTYAQMDSIAHSSMPVIPLFHDEVTHILSNDVKGGASINESTRFATEQVTWQGVDRTDFL